MGLALGTLFWSVKKESQRESRSIVRPSSCIRPSCFALATKHLHGTAASPGKLPSVKRRKTPLRRQYSPSTAHHQDHLWLYTIFRLPAHQPCFDFDPPPPPSKPASQRPQSTTPFKQVVQLIPSTMLMATKSGRTIGYQPPFDSYLMEGAWPPKNLEAHLGSFQVGTGWFVSKWKWTPPN